MDLFPHLLSLDENLLPKDGVVNYLGPVIERAAADHFFQRLRTGIDWQPDEAVIMGRHIATRRHVAWHGDRPYAYTYSRVTKTALGWTEDLLALKAVVEEYSGERFNSCLLNLYHDGSEGMAWHSDGERDLKRHGTIASVSLGAERRFAFKHKRGPERLSLNLAHGSLLLMKGETQSHWLHRLPPTKTVSEPRINLTFRTIDRA